jgi:hypothetical protein
VHPHPATAGTSPGGDPLYRHPDRPSATLTTHQEIRWSSTTVKP